METLQDNVHSHFMKGEHSIQLSATTWAGIWSDMRIEVSHNQFGKRRTGIIEQSTNIETNM